MLQPRICTGLATWSNGPACGDMLRQARCQLPRIRPACIHTLWLLNVPRTWIDPSGDDRRRRGEEVSHRVPEQVTVVAVAGAVGGMRQDDELAVAVRQLPVEVDQVLVG